MQKVADGVFQLRGFPPNAINVFLVGDVIVDAATRHEAGRILRQVRGRDVSAVVLTHAHPDHQGAAHAVCEALGAPLWCGDADAAAVERPELIGERQPNHPIAQLFHRTCTGPAHPVARRLREGDDVAGFEVLDVPGHSAGHIALWRDADRAPLVGGALLNRHPRPGSPGLREPPRWGTPDPRRNRESARRLGELQPAVVLFGHGTPLHDTAKFVRLTRSLPA